MWCVCGGGGAVFHLVGEWPGWLLATPCSRAPWSVAGAIGALAQVGQISCFPCKYASRSLFSLRDPEHAYNPSLGVSVLQQDTLIVTAHSPHPYTPLESAGRGNGVGDGFTASRRLQPDGWLSGWNHKERGQRGSAATLKYDMWCMFTGHLFKNIAIRGHNQLEKVMRQADEMFVCR